MVNNFIFYLPMYFISLFLRWLLRAKTENWGVPHILSEKDKKKIKKYVLMLILG